ncbi:terpene cyclase/mutase family protein [Pirellulales bacterium]|nr:terpene cyclase/mutase family protein [Pirellulales bacterium]
MMPDKAPPADVTDAVQPPRSDTGVGVEGANAEDSDAQPGALEATLPREASALELTQSAPSWLSSLLLHLVLIIFLAVTTLPLPSRTPTMLTASKIETEEINFEEIVEIDVAPMVIDSDDVTTFDAETEIEPVELDIDSLTESMDSIFDDQPVEMVDFSALVGDLAATATAAGMSTTGLEGRSAAARSRLVLKGGGSPESENAVARALVWLARHQLPDGSWNFDHRGGECDGACGNPGDLVKSPAGATGLALLPFLGAGNTHQTGKYRDVVENGMYALVSMLKTTPDGATVIDEGQYRMYSHGIATMALCESFAMTGDEYLRPAAQAALAFTCNAQDPNGGGWRYNPPEAGDTSMHGWHVGALKSGFMASLSVPPLVVERASYFLDQVSVDDGSGYCYSPTSKVYGGATSAIGLLCRMYMGIYRDDKGLKAGIERLVATGPNRGSNGAYFNYYAAQAIFQYTGGKGPLWEKWNDAMRDFLVTTQAQEGHEAGSWGPRGENPGSHVQHGGRLYQTAMSCMTLEVYYRLMPIYQAEATDAGFE